MINLFARRQFSVAVAPSVISRIRQFSLSALAAFIAVILLPAAASNAQAQGSLVSWGDDRFGQVTNTPTDTNFVAISASFGHSLALRADPDNGGADCCPAIAIPMISVPIDRLDVTAPKGGGK